MAQYRGTCKAKAAHPATIGAEPKPNKYHAKRVESDGYQFDSLKEARHYAGLKLLVAAGTISDLKVHPQYPIVIRDQTICFVEMDFSYYTLDGCTLVIEDVKTKATNTSESRLKRKMFQAYYGVEVTLVF